MSQWISKIDTPLSELEKKVLQAVEDGANSYLEVAQVTGINSGHCNNILPERLNYGKSADSL